MVNQWLVMMLWIIVVNYQVSDAQSMRLIVRVCSRVVFQLASEDLRGTTDFGTRIMQLSKRGLTYRPNGTDKLSLDVILAAFLRMSSRHIYILLMYGSVIRIREYIKNPQNVKKKAHEWDVLICRLVNWSTKQAWKRHLLKLFQQRHVSLRIIFIHLDIGQDWLIRCSLLSLVHGGLSSDQLRSSKDASVWQWILHFSTKML